MKKVTNRAQSYQINIVTINEGDTDVPNENRNESGTDLPNENRNERGTDLPKACKHVVSVLSPLASNSCGGSQMKTVPY